MVSLKNLKMVKKIDPSKDLIIFSDGSNDSSGNGGVGICIVQSHEHNRTFIGSMSNTLKGFQTSISAEIIGTLVSCAISDIISEKYPDIEIKVLCDNQFAVKYTNHETRYSKETVWMKKIRDKNVTKPIWMKDLGKNVFHKKCHELANEARKSANK